jgi:hypothetical protein
MKINKFFFSSLMIGASILTFALPALAMENEGDWKDIVVNARQLSQQIKDERSAFKLGVDLDTFRATQLRLSQKAKVEGRLKEPRPTKARDENIEDSAVIMQVLNSTTEPHDIKVHFQVVYGPSLEAVNESRLGKSTSGCSNFDCVTKRICCNEEEYAEILESHILKNFIGRFKGVFHATPQKIVICPLHRGGPKYKFSVKNNEGKDFSFRRLALINSLDSKIPFEIVE